MRRIVTRFFLFILVGVFSHCLGNHERFFPSAIAAVATPATLELSRHAISVGANHELRFRTPTGVDASGDTIVVRYENGFGLGSVAIGDIDLLHGSTSGLETVETLAASPAAGVWGVSVSGTDVAFTAPTDAAAGEIIAHDVVTIRIGTNAVGGVNRITNPISPGIALVMIRGTFGDENDLFIPIVASDAVSVTAVVPAPPVDPGGGGVGSQNPPSDPLIISNVFADAVTASSAHIHWQTNRAADSHVNYGLTTAHGNTVSAATLSFDHDIVLTGLQPETLYHFRVWSQDGLGQSAISADFMFVTGSASPPIIPPPEPVPLPESVCANGADDDGDGPIDCADSDCGGAAACLPSPPVIPQPPQPPGESPANPPLSPPGSGEPGTSPTVPGTSGSSSGAGSTTSTVPLPGEETPSISSSATNGTHASSSTATSSSIISAIAEAVGDVPVLGSITRVVAALGTFLRDPKTQAAIEYGVAPALVAFAVANALSTVSLFNALAYLQYLFSQPILLFGRKRRERWGVVFNALSKQPVEFAIVRLRNATTNTVMQSRVTDKYGRYAFLIKPEEYRLEVVKPGFVFPSNYLKGVREDVEYTDLYHGELLSLAEDDVAARNIPVDPVVPTETPKDIAWKKTRRAIQQNIALVTVLAAMVTFVIAPSVQVAALLLAQVGVYLLVRRLAAPMKAKEWGIVFDEVSRAPLAKAVVRIFDKKFNKLLETQVTDSNGKYGFFVRRNTYYMTVEREGYETHRSSDIDLTMTDASIVDQNVGLKVQKEISTSSSQEENEE